MDKTAKSNIKLYLAPMEGVVDFVFRDLLTKIGGIDQCTTEFVRVTDRLHPEHTFFEYCPELKTKSKTASGTPVWVQLLGGQPVPMAENAVRAAELGAAGIGLNFGCPAKTVDRHDGGATLLKTPERIFNVVSEVRKRVPMDVPVTAKIRLGFDDPSVCLENAKAVEAGGAQKIIVHCRTKMDMYKPPAYWDWIPKIKSVVSIPVVANGEIWNYQDLLQCQKVTGCDEFMIGRAAISNPFVFQEIRTQSQMDLWFGVRERLVPFFDLSTDFATPYYAVSRTKQWLSLVAKKNEPAREFFDVIKRLEKPEEFRYRLVHANTSPQTL